MGETKEFRLKVVRWAFSWELSKKSTMKFWQQWGWILNTTTEKFDKVFCMEELTYWRG